MNTEEFNQIEKEFFGEMQRIFNEINDSVKHLRKEKRFIKSELCLVLTCADSFSRFYKVFQGYNENELNNKNEERFKAWLNDFVFTEENEIYKKQKEKIYCNSDSVWELRNSLLHFYGLPKPQKDGTRISFCSSGNSDECEKLKKFIKERGEKIVLIDPYQLIELIFYGLLVQLEKMKEMIKNEPKNYIDRVLLAHKIATTEGAAFIDISKK